MVNLVQRFGLLVCAVARMIEAYHALPPTGIDPNRPTICCPLGNGLWEIRTDLPTKRTARVLLCLYREHLVALHGFIKKTRTTPEEDLAVARKRKKELER